MAETYAQLQAMSREQLIDRYDTIAYRNQPQHSHPPEIYLEELARRDAAEHTEAIRQLTRTMACLTWAIFVLTFINVAIAGWMAWKTPGAIPPEAPQFRATSP